MIIIKLKTTWNLKGTKNVISSNPPCKDANARFWQPCYPFYPINNEKDIVILLVLSFDNSFMFPTLEMRIAQGTFVEKRAW